MRFVIGLEMVVLALAPYWLVAVARKSRPFYRTWLRHGTLSSMALASLAVLSRVAMYLLLDTPQEVRTWTDSITNVIMNVDVTLMYPLESFCETLAGRQTAIPTFAMVTYGLVIYFGIYRVVGFLLSGNRDVLAEKL